MSPLSTALSDCEGRKILDSRWDGRSTFSIPEAGEILGLSRAAAYATANLKQLPVIWIGRRGIVPRVQLERLLLTTGNSKPAA
jgi:hypothetical protein